MSSSTAPRTISPGASSRVPERTLGGASRGCSETLVTRRVWSRGDQHGMFHQVACEHGAARGFGDQQLLAVSIRAPNAIHALGIIVDTAFDQECGALADWNAPER